MILITVAVTVVQILVEGARWQLVPTYVLPGVFVLVWALPHVTPADAILKQILNRPGVAGGIVIICLLDLALSAALPTALPVFHFPAPSRPTRLERSSITGWIRVAMSCSAVIRGPMSTPG